MYKVDRDQNGDCIYFNNDKGFEEWREYDNGKVIHSKDNNGYEGWWEYENGKMVHYHNSKDFHRWFFHDRNGTFGFTDSNGESRCWNYADFKLVSAGENDDREDDEKGIDEYITKIRKQNQGLRLKDLQEQIKNAENEPEKLNSLLSEYRNLENS